LSVDNYNLQVIDVLGRVVLTKNNIKTDRLALSVSNLAQGSYFLVLKDENGRLLARETVLIKR